MSDPQWSLVVNLCEEKEKKLALIVAGIVTTALTKAVSAFPF